MGRRELYIALAFLVAGLAAYIVSAPAGEGAASTRSLAAWLERWRASGRQTNAESSLQHIGTTPVGSHITEVRFAGFSELHVIGEDRPDITWTLDVHAMGPDEAAARATAAAVGLQADDLGETLAVAARLPDRARLTLSVRLRVPARLAVRVETAGTADVSGVAAVRLENLVGDVKIRAIAGAVTGTQRNGALEVTDVGGATLTLNNSRATLQRVREETTLTVRNGDCRIEDTGGAVAVDATNAAIAVVRTGGALRINATGGGTRVSDPRERVHVDVRRGRADVDFDTPVPTSLIGTDAPVAITWTGDLPVAIDASATDGAITASDFGLTAEQHANVSRLVHAFGTRARVVVRTTRSPIVIAKRK
jgi:hypothetical protein